MCPVADRKDITVVIIGVGISGRIVGGSLFQLFYLDQTASDTITI